jgi:hypothetical protein
MEKASVAIVPKGDVKAAGSIELADAATGIAVNAKLRDLPKETLQLAFVDTCEPTGKVLQSIGEITVKPDGTAELMTTVAQHQLGDAGDKMSMKGQSVAIRDSKDKNVACGRIESSMTPSSGTTTKPMGQ